MDANGRRCWCLSSGEVGADARKVTVLSPTPEVVLEGCSGKEGACRKVAGESRPGKHSVLICVPRASSASFDCSVGSRHPSLVICIMSFWGAGANKRNRNRKQRNRASVYADVNQHRPREYWNYEALTIQWGYVSWIICPPRRSCRDNRTTIGSGLVFRP